ncbi:Nitrosoguanidine resistance protein SNG1 [Candida viswanathii]|uniref:Nitrosoguanidine resistance protein SNG1 n=1 Tax=Candida viswanathii TaxID=5486 RepID=A0A367YI36_9ASCO|nr:Nitrosoguanidine resistance protein SNG1 [Candida viswanathii]
MPDNADEEIDPMSPGKPEQDSSTVTEKQSPSHNGGKEDDQPPTSEDNGQHGEEEEDNDSDDDDDDSAAETNEVMDYGGLTGDIVDRVETQEYETAQRKKELKERNIEEKKLTPKERVNEYYQAAPKFIFAYVKVFCIYVGFLSIYWGAMYRRDTRFKNINYAVINQDTEFEFNGATIQPYLGNAMENMLLDNSTVRKFGDFVYPNMTAFIELAQNHNNTLFEEMEHKIHHQKYWGGIYIAPNSTQKIYESFYNANATFMTSGAINESITVVYETGRHFGGVVQYTFRNLDFIGQTWVKEYVYQQIYLPIIQLLNATQKRALLTNNETAAIFSTFPVFSFKDNAPSPAPEMIAVAQIELIYCLLISFYSFTFSAETYGYMRKKLVYRNYLFFKFLISQLHYFLLGLVYALMVKAFRIPTSVTFGKLGFLVLWMFVSLFIAAEGAANEVVVLIIFAYDKKVLIAPWMVFNIVSNVAVAFGPLDLLPGFYRYGYAWPMYNAYELIRVVFFNTWKGHMGRNIGVLWIWIVVGNILLVFISNWASKRAKRIAREERRKQREEEKRLDKEAGL